ncbi:L-lysine exporter family protein LysE/ArgO [Aeromicrobium sp. SORGH_AS981]|uniref:LysE/ArgO family amino acid transporter n=1 Tax=Aeromicrobium sp. SORGH_AS_0981 TaxID=3041802 RepID=UPI00285B798C|nr:LysE/ArgO family amino acid transporter [Aeromicrobium sp. SORGH_AS_0981]MDR6120140.1 L-lysine exporter family protein LysE/ArgO [Aeromicrobium sp. SORGH_AS_0981]
MTSLLSGLGAGLALIVAIGAQNAFVLRQGLRREHVGLVVAVCALSDVVLVAVGVVGLGRLVESVPWFVDAARWGGAAFLAGYAVLALRRAATGSGESLEVEGDAHVQAGGLAVRVRPSARRVGLTALALTWLNPHVYLDTVVLLGSVAASHGDARGWFAGGAMTGSVVWFAALGFGARHLGRWLREPRAWRLLDGAIGCVMLVLAAGIVLR